MHPQRQISTPASRAVRLGASFLAFTAVLAPSAASAAAPSKASSHLLRARDLLVAGKSAQQMALAAPSVRMRDGEARVQVRLHSLTPAIEAALGAAGMTIDSKSYRSAMAYGSIDLARLDRLARIAEVSTIAPMPRVGRRTGSALSQGDMSINADASDGARSLGVDGSGVTVGILSDSFNDGLNGTISGGLCACSAPNSTCSRVVNGMDNQTSLDLPASIPILDDCTAGSPDCDFLSDEGAALGEIIHDLAPGAGLMFHSAFNSPDDFAEGIGQLVNCGAQVLIDDVFWTFQPFFQDGVIAQAAQTAVDSDVPYFSATGNDATYGVDDAFSDSGAGDDPNRPSTGGQDLHDFGGGDRFAQIVIPAGCDLYAELQWTEPWSGALGPGASSDLDLYLLSSPAVPDTNILDAGTDPQGCGETPVGECMDGICRDPVEFALYINPTGSNKTVYLAVDHVCGDQSVRFRIVNLSFDCSFSTGIFDADPSTGYDFEDGVNLVNGLPVPDGSETPIFTDAQVFGHPAADGVVAVGASFFREIDTNGTTDPDTMAGKIDVEPFSSLGGDLPFYFDSSGAALPGSPVFRHKPDIVGPDGVNTSFFGIDLVTGYDTDSDPNFFGTSAAAPHAAAVAALMVEMTNLSPSGVEQTLQSAAVDIEEAGIDDLSSYGLIEALDSVGTTLPTAPLDCYIDDLVLDGKPNTGAQSFRACSSITAGGGDFSGVTARAPNLIFTDGFESGDTSSWGSN